VKVLKVTVCSGEKLNIDWGELRTPHSRRARFIPILARRSGLNG